MPESTTPERNASKPLKSLGGLSLNDLAKDAHAESKARIAGQGGLQDAYVNSVLDDTRALGTAGAERDNRMFDFRRSMALLEEQTEARRRGQAAAIQREKIGSAAAQAAAERAWREEQMQDERSFELGQIAASRANGDLERQLLEAQVAAAQQGLQPPQTQFGGAEVSGERGAQISAGMADRLRNRVVDTESRGGTWGPLNIGARDVDVTLSDLLQDERQGLYETYQQDPTTVSVQQQLAEKLGTDDPVLLSFALSELGLFGGGQPVQ